MKRLIALVVSLICLFSFSSCRNQAENPRQEPPSLTVQCGSETVEALLSTYSWSIVSSDGKGRSISADGKHPVELLDLYTPLPLGSETTATLSFEVKPLSVTVKCWNENNLDLDDASNLYADCMELDYDNGTITLPTDGNYIYEVLASWENGSAYYAFYTIKA